MIVGVLSNCPSADFCKISVKSSRGDTNLKTIRLFTGKLLPGVLTP